MRINEQTSRSVALKSSTPAQLDKSKDAHAMPGQIPGRISDCALRGLRLTAWRFQDGPAIFGDDELMRRSCRHRRGGYARLGCVGTCVNKRRATGSAGHSLQREAVRRPGGNPNLLALLVLLGFLDGMQPGLTIFLKARNPVAAALLIYGTQ